MKTSIEKGTRMKRARCTWSHIHRYETSLKASKIISSVNCFPNSKLRSRHCRKAQYFMTPSLLPLYSSDLHLSIYHESVYSHWKEETIASDFLSPRPRCHLSVVVHLCWVYSDCCISDILWWWTSGQVSFLQLNFCHFKTFSPFFFGSILKSNQLPLQIKTFHRPPDLRYGVPPWYDSPGNCFFFLDSEKPSG